MSTRRSSVGTHTRKTEERESIFVVGENRTPIASPERGHERSRDLRSDHEDGNSSTQRRCQRDHKYIPFVTWLLPPVNITSVMSRLSLNLDFFLLVEGWRNWGEGGDGYRRVPKEGPISHSCSSLSGDRQGTVSRGG